MTQLSNLQPLAPNQLLLLDQVQQIVAERMAGQQAGHGLDHVERVLHNAQQIQSETGGDRFIVELACWLHDVGDAKFNEGIERSAEISREILCGLGASLECTEQVASIVDNISFRKGRDASILTLEGRIVQDADRLEALGAIGIVRTIEYGAAFDQPFFRSGSADEIASSRTGVGHFFQKLFRLRELLNTDAARRLAGEREQFMREFLVQYFSEVGLPESTSRKLLRGQHDQRQ